MTVTILNGALAVHHTDTVDTPWDGPAAVANMPNDQTVLRYCHAYADASGKPEAKGSYSMPHHKADGSPASLAACRNALARLSNSSIPTADRPGVERHLKAHLTDGGSDEPTNHHHDTGGGAVTAQRREWFQIRNSAGDEPAQVYIYDMIGGGGWFGGGITAMDFVTEISAIKSSAIDLHINSPGGDVFDGIAIYNALRRHPAHVTSYVDSLAASAASFIALAGDEVVTEPQGQWMVHDASGGCYGNAADMAAMTDLLNKASDNIAGIYAARTGVAVATWRDAMRTEVWYSSEEAVLAGLSDRVAEDPARPDDRLTGVSRFDLKALGARYASRQEAPDPPVARVGVASRCVPLAVALPDLPGVAASTTVTRPAARGDVDVAVAPPRTPTLSPFEQAVLLEFREGIRSYLAPAPAPSPPKADPVTAPAAAPPAPAEALNAFDPAAFRAAVRTGLQARTSGH